MTKHYILSAVIAILVTSALILVMFLLMLPQVADVSADVVPKYARIESDDYEYVETKQLVTEILSKKYALNGEDINRFANNNQYKPGNYNPFTPKDAETNSTKNSTSSKASSSTSSSNSTSTRSGSTISGTTK